MGTKAARVDASVNKANEASGSPLTATNVADVRIEPATELDVPVILSLIKALAEYERE